ncbi:hypothetical protein RUM44_012472 [Polyplax serrata]|uniref:Uncharacterized protein n=1 Tax=Polyplax serrata TaxID=468196 RepID=A0ABR1BFT8_POLSC
MTSVKNYEKVRHYKQRQHNQEIAPEQTLKAPPPTPCISVKQRSGSVPDVRIVDIKREKPFYTGQSHRNFSNALSCSHRPSTKPVFETDWKRSTSDHAMANISGRAGPWMVLMSPCTSNLLHSVRQRLMNL